MGDMTRRDFLRVSSLASFLALTPQAEELLNMAGRIPTVG